MNIKKIRFFSIIFLLIISGLILVNAKSDPIKDTNDSNNINIKDNKNPNNFKDVWDAINDIKNQIKTLSNSITNLQNQIINITLKPGPPGPPGPQGPTGLQGPLGIPGPTKPLESSYDLAEKIEIYQNWPEELNDGLQGYWAMDSNSSGVIVDSLGNQNGNIVGGGIALQSGKIGNGLFQSLSAGGCGSVPDNSYMNLGRFQSVFENGVDKDWTVSFWYYANPVNTNQATSLFSYWTTDINFNPYGTVYFSRYNSDLVFSFGGAQLPAPTALNDNDWNLITITKNSNTIQIYNNGALIYNEVQDGLVDLTREGNFVGLARWSNCAYQMPGGFDEIGIWNRTLSTSEVQQLYNNGNGISYPKSSIYFYKACCPSGWIRSGCSGNIEKDRPIKPTENECCESQNNELYAICIRYADDA